MTISEQQQVLLRALPGVDRLLEMSASDADLANAPRETVARCARQVVEQLRRAILQDTLSSIQEADLAPKRVIDSLRKTVEDHLSPRLVRCINATGVVVHTNLGRSLLAAEALENIVRIGGHYSNLEFDLQRGKRGSRYSAVEDLICEISGAEAAMVVNNNAGAVLLCLETIARGREVIVSRGELVEIGGAFRIPDVMTKSGAVLKEVGATNRTHLKDYHGAIAENTALLLKVHASNYALVGFTAEVSLEDLVTLGRETGLPVMQDLGSGTFIDFSRYGLTPEPTVQESVRAGTDLVTFSGDKLLGGPQAGIIVGRKELVDQIKQNPLTRALRIDKLTLASLESTLSLYRDPAAAVERIPTLRMLTQGYEPIDFKARALAEKLGAIGDNRLQIELLDRASKAGGGSLPLLDLPSRCVAIRMAHLSANRIEKRLRHGRPPIIGRIDDDFFLMDLRTVQDDELDLIKTAVGQLLQEDLS